MKSITDSPSFYHWRLAKHGGAYMFGSVAAAIAAGFVFVAARNAGWVPGLIAPPTWAIVGFIALVLVSALLWLRFSSFQDEMFHRIQNYSYGRSAVFTVALLGLWGIANAATLAPPITPFAPVFVFAIAKSFFWMRAVRTWL